RRFGVECGRDCLLVTFHPASAGNDSQSQLAQLLKALDRLTGLRAVFTGSNADAEGAALTRTVREYAESHPERAAFVMSFGREAYLAAAKGCAAVVGNSSSGVIEVPVLGIPSVDIGDRQSGRIHPASVVHSEPDASSIQTAIELAVSDDFRARASVAANPYGDGHAAERMIEVLARWDRNNIPAAKRFFDIDVKGCTDAS
ncbi:MAG: UDP-N-acetylglucosamine 2-epimerase, partial [Coriobacteriia bacterium]